MIPPPHIAAVRRAAALRVGCRRGKAPSPRLSKSPRRFTRTGRLSLLACVQWPPRQCPACFRCRTRRALGPQRRWERRGALLRAVAARPAGRVASVVCGRVRLRGTAPQRPPGRLGPPAPPRLPGGYVLYGSRPFFAARQCFIQPRALPACSRPCLPGRSCFPGGPRPRRPRPWVMRRAVRGGRVLARRRSWCLVSGLAVLPPPVSGRLGVLPVWGRPRRAGAASAPRWALWPPFARCAAGGWRSLGVRPPFQPVPCRQVPCLSSVGPPDPCAALLSDFLDRRRMGAPPWGAFGLDGDGFQLVQIRHNHWLQPL